MHIKINGQDWSKDIDPYSIEIYHVKVQGPNAGISQSGNDIFDTIKVKECFTATAGLLTQEKYTALMFLSKQDFVTVYYTDPDTNADVIRVMSLTSGKAKQIPLLGGGYAYKNILLDFKER